MRNALILATPFMIQVFWSSLFAIFVRHVYPKLAPDSRGLSDSERAAISGRIPYIGERGQPIGKWGWLRRLELIYILWLFPVMVPAVLISRTDTGPWWVVIAVPTLYSLLLYFIAVRGS